MNRNVSAGNDYGRPSADWRQKLYVIIFEADTPAGKRFDLILIVAVLLSVFTVILDSVASIAQQYQPTTRTCPECMIEGLDADAKYCKNCGVALPPYEHI